MSFQREGSAYDVLYAGMRLRVLGAKVPADEDNASERHNPSIFRLNTRITHAAIAASAGRQRMAFTRRYGPISAAATDTAGISDRVRRVYRDGWRAGSRPSDSLPTIVALETESCSNCKRRAR
jgi:hypothetical protein